VQLAIEYQQKGDFSEAYRLALVAESMLSNNSEFHQKAAVKLLIGQLSMQRGQFEEAMKYCQELDTLLNNENDSLSFQYFWAINQSIKGESYFRNRNPRKALDCYSKLTEKIDYATLSAIGLSWVALEVQIGLCEYQLGRAKEALTHYNKIILAENGNIEIDFDTFLSVRIHASSCYLQLSDLKAANQELIEIEDAINSQPSISPIVVSQFLNAKAALLTQTSNFNEAAEIMKESIKITEENIDNPLLADIIKEHYLMTLRQYIIVLTTVKNTREALTQYEKAIVWCEELNLNRSVIFLDLIHGKFRIECQNSNVDGAIELLNKYNDEFQLISNTGNMVDEVYYIRYLNFLVDAFAYFGADKDLYLGDNNVASKAANVADRIKMVITEFLDDYEPTYGNSLTFRLALRQLCFDNLVQGDYDFGIKTARLSMTKFLEAFYEGSELLTKSSREQWLHLWRINSTWFPMVKYADNPELTRLYFDVSLATKCIELEMDKAFDAMPNDEMSLSIFNQINELKKQKKTLSVELDAKSSLDNQIRDLELRLIALNPGYKDINKSLRMSSKDVQASLESEDILIDIIASEDLLDSRNIYYYAILWKHIGDPIIIKLNYYHHFDEVPNPLEKLNELYDEIWLALEPYLTGNQNVYFCPDGCLTRIPIEILTDHDGLMACYKWNIYRISSPRVLLKSHSYESKSNVAIFGGLDYDMSYDEMNEFIPKCLTRISNSSDMQNRRGLTRARFDNLPGTLIEAKTLSQIINVNSNIVPSVYTGVLGSEETFHSLSGKRVNLLHIATHGFYFDDDEVSDRASTGKYAFLEVSNDESETSEDKIMTHSGIIFSGANNALRGQPVPEDREDGILTAQELSQLDFQGLDLVVLSACETGLGSLTNEGVFGLQRGFKKAGTNSILMSLWDVDDEATCELMISFYHNYFAGLSKKDALRNAQKSLIENPRFSNPKYWAAWILLDALN
jgi:CHAT domain-containing protein